MQIITTARRLVTGAILSTLALLAFGSAASAADVTFQMRYSQDRSHVWPGGNQVYYLDDGETKSMSLSCDEGEKICYGAWVSGDKSTYWGTGPDNAETCSDCCYTCTGGNTEEINLVP
jgi:hypothetical protein